MRRKNVQLKSDRPKKFLIEIDHEKQKRSWDCGLACVCMVLPQDLREQFLRNLRFVCKDEGFNKSIWTIDLCYLLSRFGVTYTFYTTTLGVHPGYKKNSFYKRVLSRDEKRVNERFFEAAKNGINIKKATLDVCKLLEHLVYGPVIVLTNARLLCCERCKLNKVSFELRTCLPWSQPYQGHFIVLCGYDIDSRKVFYRNPSLSDRVCVMSVECFEKSRRSYGTDEDLIFVHT